MELQAVTASAATGLTLITMTRFMPGMFLAPRRAFCARYREIAAAPALGEKPCGLDAVLDNAGRALYAAGAAGRGRTMLA